MILFTIPSIMKKMVTIVLPQHESSVDALRAVFDNGVDK
jgi:hypothetical protein